MQQSISTGDAKRPTQTDAATITAIGEGYLDLGQHRLGYERRGHGPDVVFVHGWPLHSATFRNIVPHLERDFTCHLLDLVCAGRSSSASGADVSFSAQIRVLRAAIDALGLTRYAFVAHDSGGLLARYVAADDARVAGLVLGTTELPGRVPSVAALLGFMANVPFGPALFRALMRNRTFLRSPLGFAPYLESREHLEGEFHRLFLAPILASTDASQRAISGITDFKLLYAGLADVHRRLRAPALLIWGARDTLFPLRGARAMLPQFGGGAELEVIEHGKLFFHEEHPEEFGSLARAFLGKQLLAK